LTGSGTNSCSGRAGKGADRGQQDWEANLGDLPKCLHKVFKCLYWNVAQSLLDRCLDFFSRCGSVFAVQNGLERKVFRVKGIT
jgi:hypothetical protein